MAQNRKSFGYPLRSSSTMAAPSALVLKCPQCGEVVPHRVLRGKIGGKDEIVYEGVVRCSKCDATSNVVTREPKPIVVPLILSWLDRSEKTSIWATPGSRSPRSNREAGGSTPQRRKRSTRSGPNGSTRSA